MKKALSLAVSIAMSFSLFSTAVFAADSNSVTPVTPTAVQAEQQTVPTTVSTDVKTPVDTNGSATVGSAVYGTTTDPDPNGMKPAIDQTGDVQKGGMYVEIPFKSEGYVPKFTLELRGADGKAITTVDAGGQNYDQKLGKYKLVFNNPGYKLGEVYQVLLGSSDASVKNLVFYTGMQSTILKVGQYHEFTVSSLPYVDKDGVQPYNVLSASKERPLPAQLITDNTKAVFYLSDENSAPLKKTKFTLKLASGKGNIDLVTDGYGIATIDSGKLTSRFILSAEGKNVEGSSTGLIEFKLPFGFTPEKQKSALIYSAVFSSPKTQGSVAVDFSTTANNDLSSDWSTTDITVTNADGVDSNFTVSQDNASISGLTDGKYTVKASAQYADVKLSTSTITVTNGTAKLGVSVEPKHKLQVDKDGKGFNFTVINVSGLEDKVYSGKSPQTFAVTPGQSFMIKDNDSGEVTTVAIDSNSPVTRLVLGAGVVFGGSASTPHTGDAIMYLIGLFVAALLGAVVSFIIYRKKKGKIGLRTSLTSLLLIVALVSQVLPAGTQTAHADFGSGSKGEGGGSKTPIGRIQTHDSISVLQVGFTDSRGKLLDTSGIPDLTTDTKFSQYNQGMMFYMATNNKNRNAFLNEGSAVLSFDGMSTQIMQGRLNPLFKDDTTDTRSDGTKNQSKQDMINRLLAPAEDIIASPAPNNFDKFIAEAVTNMGAENENRNLWSNEGRGTSSSTLDIGDALSNKFLSSIRSKLHTDSRVPVIDGNSTDEQWADLQARMAMDLIFYGYVDKVREFVGAEQADELTTAYFEGKDTGAVTLVAQVMPAFYISGHNTGSYAFMPYNDAARWFQTGRQQEGASIYGDIDPYEEARITYARFGKYGKLDNGGLTLADQYPTYTFVGNVRPTVASALKPQNDTVTIPKLDSNSPDNLDVNPFMGWGFVPWGYGHDGEANKPLISAQQHITVVDAKTGAPIGEPKISDVDLWGAEAKKELNNLTGSADSLTLSGNMQLLLDDGIYEIIPEQAPFTLVDTADNENIDKPTPLLMKTVGQKGTVSVPSKSGDGSQWLLTLGTDTLSLPTDLASYLGAGAPKDSLLVNKSDNKYAGATTDPKFGNAKLTIYLKAKKIANVICVTGVCTSEPVTASHEVPQWRLSKYMDNISSSGLVTQSIMKLTLPATTYRNAFLNPSGNLYFGLVNPDLKDQPWAMSRAKLIGDKNVKNVSVPAPYANFTESGDLLAVKDNKSVGNVKLADWKNNFNLFVDRIGSASQGSAEADKTNVAKQFTFSYGVKSPSPTYIYSEDRLTRWVPRRWGGYYDWERWTSGPITPNYITADYNTTVNFLRYNPKDNVAPKAFAPAKESVNGKYWETAQDADVLKVNPEVLMAYDDQSGRTSVAFAAGDKQKDIKPVHYNLAQFMRVNVDPTLTGMSTATDTKAQQLGASIANGKAVVYKGSATTTNFEVVGDLELKTFALDIGSSALKNSWNPGTTYSTDAINNEFLTRHASKDAATGKWKVTLDSTGKLVIGKDGADAKEYGGQTGQVVADQKSVAVKEHTLEIRGGKLNAVDGNRNLDSLPQELKDALTNMKVMGDDNIFNNLENGSGDNLSEATVANLGNAVRGTSDLSNGKGWYNEDSTVLIVREYTNTFTLPSFMYVDKIPMEVDGLATPMDKNQFFTATGTSAGGKEGHLKLTYKVVDAFMTADDSKGGFGSTKQTDYVVPNVSVMDTFTTQ
jgi:hypothetical protein